MHMHYNAATAVEFLHSLRFARQKLCCIQRSHCFVLEIFPQGVKVLIIMV